MILKHLSVLLILGVASPLVHGADAVPEIPAADFDRLLGAIKPSGFV